MCSETSSNILPEPPEELKCVSAELASEIRAKIALSGPIPFSEYMEMALYEPGLGYYSAGLHKLGESGDFVTAPELGSLFASFVLTHLSSSGGSGRMSREVAEHIGG